MKRIIVPDQTWNRDLHLGFYLGACSWLQTLWVSEEWAEGKGGMRWSVKKGLSKSHSLLWSWDDSAVMFQTESMGPWIVTPTRSCHGMRDASHPTRRYNLGWSNSAWLREKDSLSFKLSAASLPATGQMGSWILKANLGSAPQQHYSYLSYICSSKLDANNM